jgi:DnaJ-class molecular chaperone
MAKTLYQILGVPADATPEAIGAAHLRLVERVPPLDAVQRLAVKEAYGTPFRTIAASITG